MKKFRSLNRVISVIVLVCFTWAILGDSVMAGEANQKIVLKANFWKGTQFQQGTGEKKGLLNYFKVGLTSDFENALAPYPPALKEAKKALPFTALSNLFSWGLLVMSGLELANTIGATSDPMSYKAGFNLLPFLGCVGGMIITGLIGGTKIKNAVKMYNENLGSASASSSQSTGSDSAVPASGYSDGFAPASGSSTVGFKVGLNMANQGITNQGIQNPMTTGLSPLVFGGFMTFPVSNNVSIQTEALYSPKGSKLSDFSGSLTSKLTYLDFPVLVKYTFPTSGTIKPYLFSGPSLGILMSANGKLEVPGVGSESGSIKELYKSTDFGLIFGGGVNVGSNMSIDGRYSMGMSNIASSEWPAGISIKNSSVSLMVGYSM